MPVEGPPRLPYTRFGFSPHAIFSPCGAPGNFMPCTEREGTFLMVTPRPPNRLAEPGSTWSAVMPPASASAKFGSCGQIECSAQTCAVFGLVASLPSLCDSMEGDG